MSDRKCGIYNRKVSLKREGKPCKMKPKKKPNGPIQCEMLKVPLKDIVSESHPLVKLADISR
jgi:hypothetical protein